MQKNKWEGRDTFKGTTIYGVVIGRCPDHSYLIAVPTANKIKFKLVSKELIQGGEPAIEEKVNFIAGKAPALSPSKNSENFGDNLRWLFFRINWTLQFSLKRVTLTPQFCADLSISLRARNKCG